MAAQKYPVGIDLGTTFSSLAYIDDSGNPQAIRLTDDDATVGSTSYSIASAVYFKSLSEVVVGNRALDYSVIDATRIATRFKRQMGDPVYHRDVHDEANSKVPFQVEGKTFRPEELSAMVLKRLKQAGEEQLGPISEVVISVPFVFDEARRRATQNAGRIAGFSKVELIDEPVAAAIAYGHNLFQGAMFREGELQDLLADQRILVYDLGGGTFDATIVQLQTDGVFNVLATRGDERLGGSDWDDVLLNIVVDRFIELTKDSPRRNPELMQELLLQTIEAKKTLTLKPRADIKLEYKGEEVTITVQRGHFESNTRHLMVRTTDTINEMLQDLEQEWNYCDKLVVVGGASRMRMIGEHIRKIAQREIDLSLSPDTAIAYGAALFAALKSGRKTGLMEDVQTVNSHTLGLLVKDPGTQRAINDIVIAQNTKTRTMQTKSYVVQDPSKGVTLVVLLGDSDDPNYCLKVGRLRITPPPGQPLPAKGVKPTVAVTYGFKDNGLLSISGVLNYGKGTKPVQASVELQVANTMSDEQVQSAEEDLKGISTE